MIRHVALSDFILALFPAPLEMPESEKLVQLVSVSQRHDHHADTDPHKNVKPNILVMSKVASSQGEQDRPEKPSCAPDDEELGCRQVPQSKNVTQPILRKAWDQEEEKDKEGRFVVQEIVESLHRGFGDESLYQRPAECSCEDKGDVGTDGESDSGEHDTEKFTEEVPSKKACHFTGDWGGNHLSNLKNDKDEHGPRAEGIQIVRHSLFVEEKLDDAGLVENDSETPYDKDENQKPEPDVDYLSLLRLLRVDVVFRRIIPLQLRGSQLAAFLQIQSSQYTLVRL